MDSKRVVHFEIPANDPDKLCKFYSDLLGWSFRRSSEFEYWECDTGEGYGISGAVMRRQHPQQSVTNYVGVMDIPAALAKLESLGGTVAMGKTAVPGRGYFAVALDPENNPIGFWTEDANAA